jgi:glutaredoxin
MSSGIYLRGRPNDPLVISTIKQLLTQPKPLAFTFVPISTRVQNPEGLDESVDLAKDAGSALLMHDGDLLELPLQAPVAASLFSQTAVVPVSDKGSETVLRLFDEGQSFHYTRVSGNVGASAQAVEGRIDRDDRDFSSPLPGGLVMLGRRKCPHTEAAMDLLASKGLSFLYVDIEKQVDAYKNALTTQLGRPFLFSEKMPRGEFHNTVPCIFLNGALLGGRAEIVEAVDDPNTLETIEDEIGRFASRVVYFGLGSEVQSVLRAVEDNKVVRVQAVTL